jgi:Flp pilus assembly protein TadD
MGVSMKEKQGVGFGKLQVPLLFILLASLVWFVFSPTLHFDFVNFDDDSYVYDNSFISNGVTWRGIQWILTNEHVGNWHPLTSLSHMLDCELYGLNPSGHHITNILFHLANTLLLFWVLYRMTGSIWRSFFAAAFWGIHPLRVESVAWVSERKDVLSGFFFMLTLLAYLGYVKRCKMQDARCGMGDVGDPGARRLLSSVLRPLSSGFYWLVGIFFALGLLSKPMLVTLPFVLLLMDFWPLGRFGRCGVEGYGSAELTKKKRKDEPQQPATNNKQPLLLKPFFFLIWEKAPFFIISGVFCIVTVWAQQKALSPLETLSLPARIANALISYVTYIWQTFFPFGLAVFYPLTGVDLSWWRVGGSFLFLVGITSLVFRYAWKSASPNNQYPITNHSAALAAGWLLYLGMLIPVIGIIQVGGQAHADRYSYLPQIGLLIAFIWWVAGVLKPRGSQAVLVVVCGLLMGGLIVRTRGQISVWTSNLSLWSHAADVCPSALAYSSLGLALVDSGKIEEGIEMYRKSLNINPNYPPAHNNYGVALKSMGKSREAIDHLSLAAHLRPRWAEPLNNLAGAYFIEGAIGDAEKSFRMALEQSPSNAIILNNLATVLMKKGDEEEAETLSRQALLIDPALVDASLNLGKLLAKQRKFQQGVRVLLCALEYEPENPVLYMNIGLMMELDGKTQDAVRYYEKSLELSPGIHISEERIKKLLRREADRSPNI